MTQARKICQQIGLFPITVKVGKPDNMMNIESTLQFFFCSATLLTLMTIARTGTPSLPFPIRPIIVGMTSAPRGITASSVGFAFPVGRALRIAEPALGSFHLVGLSGELSATPGTLHLYGFPDRIILACQEFGLPFVLAFFGAIVMLKKCKRRGLSQNLFAAYRAFNFNATKVWRFLATHVFSNPVCPTLATTHIEASAPFVSLNLTPLSQERSATERALYLYLAAANGFGFHTKKIQQSGGIVKPVRGG